MPGKVEILRKLHQGPPILVLPNAWDVASARIFEAAGFPAIATTSAGVANSLGYPDVERIPRDEMIWMVRRIARSVSVPVTADVEAGYGDPVGTARAVLDAGAVGMNLEDSSIDGSLIWRRKFASSSRFARQPTL
jgi:2-methylisocitrate lyase-like PEP mutase family enzyme